jgi:hypothetical protein
MNAIPNALPVPEIFGQTRDPSYPAPAELAHVSIYTGENWLKMAQFYMVVLNMRFVYQYNYPNFDFIALSFDDENHRVGLVHHKVGAVEAQIDRGKQPRLEHTSWLYHRFEDVLQAAKRVNEELGIWPVTANHQGKGLTISYRDPDGNRVELVSTAFSKAQILHNIETSLGATGQEARDYSETYLAFDMAKMVALYDSGVGLDKLKDRSWVAERVKAGEL